MDELELEGRTYLSARRAAKEHGYATDYIGQLIRSGKIVGQKVGRAWFVEKQSLEAFVSGGDVPPPAKTVPTVLQPSEPLQRRVPVSTLAEEHAQAAMPTKIQEHIYPTVPSVSTKASTSRYPLLTYHSDDEESLLPALAARSAYAASEEAAMPQREVPIEEAQVHEPSRAYSLIAGIGTAAALLLFAGFLAVSEENLAYDGATQSASSTLSLNFERLAGLFE